MKRVILMSAVALAALASDGLFAGSAANMSESASAADKAKSLWTEDIDGAFKTAAKDKKPVFVNFTGSDWCYWCILADKNIFSTGQWEKFSEKMVCLKVDFPKNGRPDAETMSKRFALAKRFGVAISEMASHLKWTAMFFRSLNSSTLSPVRVQPLFVQR